MAYTVSPRATRIVESVARAELLDAGDFDGVHGARSGVGGRRPPDSGAKPYRLARITATGSGESGGR